MRVYRVIGLAIDLIAVRDQRQRSPGQGIAACCHPDPLIYWYWRVGMISDSLQKQKHVYGDSKLISPSRNQKTGAN